MLDLCMNAPLTALRTEVRLIGHSAAVLAMKDEIDRAARSDAKVLITGETGAGKEVIARLIHYRSGRASAPIVTLNCAGLPDSLLESELFGHVRGSFTGAYRDKPGLVELAPNGTLFLDEVGEMSPRMQVVLLRFVESGEFQRVGSDHPKRVNVRLITATNRDLEVQIAAGAFREDLYFRLNVIPLLMPPLRERPEDIPLLVEFFLRAFGQAHNAAPLAFSPAASQALAAYRWPGNVRELKNVIERVVLRAPGPVLDSSDLPAEVSGIGAVRSATALPVDAEHQPAAHAASRAEALLIAMIDGRDSFWSAVHPLFMTRDLTRKELRALIQIGLARTDGNYRQLVELFRMPAEDYKRFVAFLRKHDCHQPFRRFRVRPGGSGVSVNEAAGS
jgi:transcriptional regulator with GAF, ATPase, and Fis domain